MPWYAPGTAPINSPCGTAGGNPGGCVGAEGEQFGDCCGGANAEGNHGCGGWSMGQNMEDYDWPGAPVTEWEVGSIQEVAWFVSANHGGGYVIQTLSRNLKKETQDLLKNVSSKPTEVEGDKLVTYPYRR
eukprot:TRINITY_DN6470_c0_g1_i1.p1 TRINITY_DN6470_c0_g1~~TRINITY_DN6470_c0_g1_i1.p1  ORF type:complete len:130 (-),score=27.73 TRINITY_DN6470_c0_g1_i1:297-686(-)